MILILAVSNRKKRLNEWHEEQAKNIASKLDIELTGAHLQVVHSLREHYREHGESESGQQLTDMLDNAFASQGGKKYLYRLFSEGPVSLRVCALPVYPFLRTLKMQVLVRHVKYVCVRSVFTVKEHGAFERKPTDFNTGCC